MKRSGRACACPCCGSIDSGADRRAGQFPRPIPSARGHGSVRTGGLAVSKTWGKWLTVLVPVGALEIAAGQLIAWPWPTLQIPHVGARATGRPPRPRGPRHRVGRGRCVEPRWPSPVRFARAPHNTVLPREWFFRDGYTPALSITLTTSTGYTRGPQGRRTTTERPHDEEQGRHLLISTKMDAKHPSAPSRP